MEDHKQDSRYELLYTQLLERGMDMHMSTKRRIRKGLILLILLPLILGIIRAVTDSDRIVFLIIWVFCMFVISIYLITVEYIDDAVQKTLADVTESETEFGGLVAGTEQLEERISERHARVRAKILEQIETRRRSRLKPGGDGPAGADEEALEPTEEEAAGPESEGEEE